MKKNDKTYNAYVQILKEELVPAMGCTEPIAIAYAGAKAREVLGEIPTKCEIKVSGNIIKNVKSVIVPNTNGLKGIEAALAAGITVGNETAVLEVLANVQDKDKFKIKDYIDNNEIKVISSDNNIKFYIEVTLYSKSSYVKLIIENYHTNIVRIEMDEKIIFKSGSEQDNTAGITDRSFLNVKDIVEFADIVCIDDIKDTIARQIEYNMAISKEGLTGNWGAQIGKVLLKTYGDDIKIRAKAAAAAGSDARMSGCELPVIIVSGSGNQGMTASIPVIEYAKDLNTSDEKLYRSLIVSNLITIHQKTGIGRLSAFCGAVSAGCGAGAGIAYLNGGDIKIVSHTIVNALAIVSGIICDGAKSSCAAKIAAAVDAGILGYHMYLNGQQFYSGDGIVAKDADNTIDNVGRMAREGMRETDKEILKIMVGQ
ncbi:serine dehydratase subunit alpha family protein [Clostridium botulinum]|uniref:L-cysteine desulfidase family protein n=1 Tax=unclassified Clostridium TaxID=2614128 RepID=UPI0013C966F2|nr:MULTISPECIES: L-serine ammonia-lyase, iron-sulfur-dependent, subunit alpha [unclassified Clostridium]MBY7006932.1 serine dehydratase subunit alpha family protein [Clostridium botulinum]NFH72130.1 serine dehydratase subunit alpha family protein [Clostridium botulinum]NFH99376.1 serine dehydratase subunit alpha family protein [Clostridium botulinum]NFI63300.1 serine dehydratase subunit alpha family protein [Clostridium botulinum]NFI79930.1 serine dehydratase subunit alpha family protein [Clos